MKNFLVNRKCISTNTNLVTDLQVFAWMHTFFDIRVGILLIEDTVSANVVAQYLLGILEYNCFNKRCALKLARINVET